MKKNKKKLIILAILLLLLLAIFLIGGQTYSKYLSKIEGKGVIDVATWNFTVNGSSSIMKNINLAQTYDLTTLANNCIAPGTKGSFNIVIDATQSNTGIEYSVNFENENSKPKNLVFSYDNNITSDIKDLESYLTGTINANDDEKIKTLTINWEWKYETGIGDEIVRNDKIDTQDGINLKQYNFDVIVTGVQVEPVK